MAQAGGGAGGEVAVGGGEEDVPDVRFLLEPMADGYDQEEFNFQRRESLFIDFLEEQKVSKEELVVTVQVSRALNLQRPAAVIPLNARAARLTLALYRKWRHSLFLKMMLKASERKNYDSRIPFKYRDARQLRGDLKALAEGMRGLFADLNETCDRVKALKGTPIEIPDIFLKDVGLPM